MGKFSEEKVYGIRWVSVDNEKVKYEKIFTEEITTEQIQPVYDDFMRLVPEEDCLLHHTPLKIKSAQRIKSSSKLPVTALKDAPRRGADLNLHRYKYYVYVHFCYTVGRYSKYFMTWYPIKPHDAINYFRSHKINL